MTARLARHRLTAALLLLTVGLLVAHQHAAHAATVDVEVGDNYFRPQQITVDVGDTVRWTYSGFSEHDVKAADGSFSSGGALTTGIPYSYTFQEPGTYPYYCSFHGGCSPDGNCGGQYGVIEVVAAEPEPSSPPTTSPTAAPSPTATAEPTSRPSSDTPRDPEPEPSSSPSPSPTAAASDDPTGDAAATPSDTPSPTPATTEQEPSPAPAVTGDEDPSGASDATEDPAAPALAGDDDAVAARSRDGSGDGTGLKLLATVLVATSGVAVARARR